MRAVRAVLTLAALPMPAEPEAVRVAQQVTPQAALQVVQLARAAARERTPLARVAGKWAQATALAVRGKAARTVAVS